MQAIAAFMALANTIKRGDIVGVVGQPGKTKRGELSIFPTSLELLTPCLHMMPKTTYGARRSTARPDAHPGAPCSCAALARGVQAAATPQPPLGSAPQVAACPPPVGHACGLPGATARRPACGASPRCAAHSPPNHHAGPSGPRGL